MHLQNNDPQLIRQAAFPNQRKFLSTHLASLTAVFIVMILAGCVVQAPGSTIPAGGATTTTITNTVPTLPDNFNGAVEDLTNYALPTPVPTSAAKLSVIVSAGGSRANVRSGPGTNFPIVAKADSGATFTVVSKSQDNNWWQICCITGLTNTVTSTTWLASSVVRVAGAGEVAVPVSEQLLNPLLTAQWQVDWKCDSERCQVKQCSAVVDVKAGPSTTQPWLSMQHQVTWNDACFAKDSWVFEVDPATGKERTGEYNDNFLYSYWRGKQPGAANGVYTLKGGRSLAVWCSGPYKTEIEEGSGWTTSYEGNTCHDVRTGLLVLLSYNKRWLFTGKYQGQTYDHAYFGDSETLEQKLIDTNNTLSWVEKK